MSAATAAGDETGWRYGDFGPVQLMGSAFGLTAGAVVLTWLYDHTGGSLLAVVVWHAGYNLAVGTAAGTGATAAAVSTLVIFWGLAVIPDLAGRRGVAEVSGGTDRRARGPHPREPAPAGGAG